MTPFLRRWFAGILLALLFSRLAGAAAAPNVFPGQNEKWRYYQSPNFELYSSGSEAASRELLYKLEVLRAVFLERMKLRERKPVPITIYYFRSEDTFRHYTPAIYKNNDRYVGYYIARPDRAVIAMMETDTDESTQRTIFHEYVHHLMNVTEQRPPAWYNEGMADLFSTITVDNGEVELGRNFPGRLMELQQAKLLPLEQLFGTRHDSSIFTEDKHTGLFYAQSWALVHYCYCGQTDLPQDKLQLFLKVASSPEYNDPQKVREICQKLLGIDYPELMKRLSEYVRSGNYRYKRFKQPTVASAKEYAMRLVPLAEIRPRLAELEGRINHTARADLAMLQEAEGKPGDPRPYEVLGTYAWQERDTTLARERWDHALELGSVNPALYHEVGQIESRRWFGQFSLTFRLPDDVAARLRELLRHSIDCAPNQSAAYEMLAWVEATANDPQVANINLVQKHMGDITDKRRALLATALMLWRRQDQTNALKVLDNLATLEPDKWTAWNAEILRAKIEGRVPVHPKAEGSKEILPPMRVKIQKPKQPAPKPPE